MPIGVHPAIGSDWETGGWQSIAPGSAVSSLIDDDGLLHDAGLPAKRAESSHAAAGLEAQARFVIDSGGVIDHAGNAVQSDLF